jgi:hypothetical protein
MANVYFGDTTGQTDDNWNTSIQFTVSGVSSLPAVGSTYNNNGFTFKITSVNITSGSGTINAGATGTSAASGTLTKVSGTGAATITFSAKADVNWFSNPGSVYGTCCCSSVFNVPGTPLGRLPTTADDVIVVRTINIGPDITPWTRIVRSYFVDTNGGRVGGQINAGTFSGTVAITIGSIGGSIVCSGLVQNEFEGATITGGTFTGGILVLATGQFNISGGLFNSAVTLDTGVVILNISGGTFNVSITNPGGSSTAMIGELTVTGSPIFNCAIPSTFAKHDLSGGTYDRDLVLGVVSPTLGQPSPYIRGSFNTVVLRAGLSTSRNITIYANGRMYSNSLFETRYYYGSITISGGVFTGTISINKSLVNTLSITGGSYSPPAVTTPAVRSGNSMTFSSAALPIDPGFANDGGTFTPTVLLTGTSNEIIGAGLP